MDCWKHKSSFCIKEYCVVYEFSLLWYPQSVKGTAKPEKKTTIYLRILPDDRLFVNLWYDLPKPVNTIEFDKLSKLSRTKIAEIPRILYDNNKKFVEYCCKDGNPRRTPDIITYDVAECWCIYQCKYSPGWVIVAGKNRKHPYIQWQDKELRNGINIPKKFGSLWILPRDMTIELFKQHQRHQIKMLDANLSEVLGILKKGEKI